MKAASRGAAALTPKRVTEIIEGFGVARVDQIPGEQRRAFIDAVAKEMKGGK